MGTGLLLALPLGLCLAQAEDKDKGKKEEGPTVKMIMTKAHKGSDSQLQRVGKQLRGDDPDWAAVQKSSKTLVKLGTDLTRAKPPKGEKESWARLSGAYLKNVKALSAAAEKKDRTAAIDAFKQVTGLCLKCHKAHKGS
jgi:hypothetical protein